MKSFQLATLGLCAALCFGGCASRQNAPEPNPAPDLPPAGSDGEYETELPGPPPAEARTIRLDLDKPLEGCGLEEAYFAFDVSKPLPQSHVEMEMVAECLKHSPFQDHGILLIGHADQRGTVEYNEELSKERAESVKKLLVERGVDGSRIKTVARSEIGAKGDQPEYSHGHDRRVDVVELTVVAPR